MDLRKYLDKKKYQYREIKESETWKKRIDKKNMKCNFLGLLSNENIEPINVIYRHFATTENSLKLSLREITPSGGLSKNSLYYGLPYIWLKPITRGNHAETIVCVDMYLFYDNRLYYFQCGNPRREKTKTGTINYRRFITACKENNVDLKKYEVDNGKELKETIKAPLILTIDNLKPNYLTYGYINKVNHIDIHEAYRAGLYYYHPEFKNVFKYIDEKWPDHETNKAITNMTLGMFQSKYVGYKLTPLAKECIEWTRDTITNISLDIKRKGGKILGFNTDGVFYRMRDGSIYHGKGEGKEVGQWENDMTELDWLPLGCNWVALDGYKKGVRGFYKAMRGNYLYADEKPQEMWDCWEDILKALESQDLKDVTFDKKRGYKIDIIKDDEIIYKRQSVNPVDITNEYMKGGISL